MIITLTQNITNVSLQVGDTLYYVSTDPNLPDFASGSPTKIGTISAINGNSITVPGTGPFNVSAGDFLMFSKNKEANNTSLIGYYAEVTLKNNSTKEAELFALSSEVAESSK